MSKFARNRNKRNGGSSISSDTSTSMATIEEDMDTNTTNVDDVVQIEIAEPCVQFAKKKTCTAGENCKLDHERKLCLSFLVRGECHLETSGRKCFFEHFMENCRDFQKRGKCDFEERTGRKCSRRHERGTLYKKGLKLA